VTDKIPENVDWEKMGPELYLAIRNMAQVAKEVFIPIWTPKDKAKFNEGWDAVRVVLAKVEGTTGKPQEKARDYDDLDEEQQALAYWVERSARKHRTTERPPANH
jgi:hypothetical protein